MLPETLSRAVLSAFFKKRNDTEIPKFPAHYSMCYAKSEQLIERYRSIGYNSIDIRSFYGHGYFSRIPILREIDEALTDLSYKRGWSFFASYAYVKLVKPE